MDEKLKSILRDEFSEEILNNPSCITAVQSKLEKKRSRRSSMFTTWLLLILLGICAGQVALAISFFNIQMVVSYTVLAIIVTLFYFLACVMPPTVNMYREAFREVVAKRKDDDPLIADDDVEKIIVTEFRFSPQTIRFSLQRRVSFSRKSLLCAWQKMSSIALLKVMSMNLQRQKNLSRVKYCAQKESVFT